MNAKSEIEGYFYFNQLYFPVNVAVVTLCCVFSTDCKKQIYLQAAYIIAKSASSLQLSKTHDFTYNRLVYFVI